MLYFLGYCFCMRTMSEVSRDIKLWKLSTDDLAMKKKIKDLYLSNPTLFEVADSEGFAVATFVIRYV